MSNNVLKWGMVVTAVVFVLSASIVFPASAREILRPEPIPIDEGSEVAGDNDGISGIQTGYTASTTGKGTGGLLFMPAPTGAGSIAEVRSSEYSVVNIMLSQLLLWYR
jgi:hypothetical protein